MAIWVQTYRILADYGEVTVVWSVVIFLWNRSALTINHFHILARPQTWRRLNQPRLTTHRCHVLVLVQSGRRIPCFLRQVAWVGLSRPLFILWHDFCTLHHSVTHFSHQMVRCSQLNIRQKCAIITTSTFYVYMYFFYKLLGMGVLGFSCLIYY